MNEEVLIEVENISKKFSKNLKTSLKYGFFDAIKEITGGKKSKELRPTEFWAVKDISFQVKRGESFALIGHNGAGKSTLLKMLNGLIKPDEGNIIMRGKIGALIELGAGFNPILTGRENIHINASILGFSKKEIEEKFESIIEFSEIGDFIDTPVQNYSSGMKVRLGFAIASQMEPDILIIDEVLAVGDVGFKIKCFNRIVELKEKCAVIFVSHSMPQVSKICDYAIFMVYGKMQDSGIDLNQSINAYYDSFSYELKSTDYKGKKVVLSNLSISNQNGEKDLNYLDDIVIKCNIDNKTEKSLDTFAITLMDKDYKSIASAISPIPVEYRNNQQLVFTIPKVQLGLGSYVISFKFFSNIGTDIRGVILESYDSVLKFKVVNSPIISVASFQLKNSIELI